MATGSDVCTGCGIAIAHEAFDKGEAIRLLGKIYCAKCMKERVARSKNADVLPEFLTPRPNDLKKQME